MKLKKNFLQNSMSVMSVWERDRYSKVHFHISATSVKAKGDSTIVINMSKDLISYLRALRLLSKSKRRAFLKKSKLKNLKG
jgi:predicted site-specific integrase-resolvase